MAKTSLLDAVHPPIGESTEDPVGRHFDKRGKVHDWMN
jgi:hypothetical protein|tara:strand:- start:2623 stop:2736 length:114 start_codon:yes stop_codon:yes gene_type:complete